MTAPKTGDTGHYYRMKPNGEIGDYVGRFEVHRVEDNLCWAWYDHLAGTPEDKPGLFIWRFKDKGQYVYNRCHIWPGHPDYEPSEAEQGLIPIPEGYNEC